ncbi:dolichyl-phosphate beta-glucosyltransferase [Streptomyces heilongjiangensis]|uniref:dolichyl-phosphate beta-glucosyltransferase n=1 Tax=Streptomyces heilongjiangensis TaxID=945052 RepID=A0ABW1B9L4_9ACTN|nr:dolichyl-phosphate beta-glucosyltransferase [Streptomyces heilongjiangensis]MDC2950331.1 glycosyltransferase family 2 protein [Streptomyces heilongjiangensis]
MSGARTGVGPRVGVDLSVVIPAYNEERRLGPTLDAIVSHLTATEAAETWEVLVVDDGSTDGTREVVAAVTERDARVQLIRGGPRNRGKGHALRLGVCASYGRRVLLTDADLAAPIDELELLDKALSDGHAAAIGSREAAGARIERRQHRLRENLGRAGNLLIRGLVVPGIRDTQCGFKLFDGDRAREAFAASRLDGFGIDVEILRHFRRAGWSVAEVPIRWSHQPGSKIRARDYAHVLGELATLKGRSVRSAARSVRPADVLAVTVFLLMAVALYAGRWIDPNGRYLPDSLQDQNQWEWFFAVTADNVTHLRNPLFTDLQGFPDGVNLMANTVMLGLSVPLTPVTLALGPAVTLGLVMTLGLAATAAAWYRLFVGRLVRHRGAAFTGAALAAFAPPMVSHANAHPNFIVLFMIPLIVEQSLRLCAGTRTVRDGVVLGLMAAYQIFLGEEPLLLAAMGMLLFAAAYGAVRPDVARAAWRPLLKGLGVAVLTTLPLVAFFLSWQFFGPQSYKNIEHGDNAGNSPLALLSFAERSLLAGDARRADALSLNPTEQNAFYGWPLVLLALGIVVRLWERPLVKALGFTAVAAAVLSLGPEIRLPQTDLVVPGPWALLADRPLFESVIEGRVAMVCAPVLGMLLALAFAQLARVPGFGTRYVGFLAIALALLPIVPAPLKSQERPEVPAFIADGTWRRYVDTEAGETLVPVPLPDPGNAEALHWQTTARFGFRMPGGYYNGPYGEDRAGIYGAVPRHTSALLREVRHTGRTPVIGEAWQAQARKDFAYWHAGALVLRPQYYDEQLRATVDKLVGRPGRWVGGVWVWDLHEGD